MPDDARWSHLFVISQGQNFGVLIVYVYHKSKGQGGPTFWSILVNMNIKATECKEHDIAFNISVHPAGIIKIFPRDEPWRANV